MVGAPSCCCPVDFVLPARSYRGRDERVPLEVAGPQGVSVVLPQNCMEAERGHRAGEFARTPLQPRACWARSENPWPGRVKSCIFSWFHFGRVCDGEEESFHVTGVSQRHCRYLEV